MANNILKYKNFPIGKSIHEQGCDKIVEEIFNLSNNENCKIIYPEDVVVGKDLNSVPKIKNLNQIRYLKLVVTMA